MSGMMSPALDRRADPVHRRDLAEIIAMPPLSQGVAVSRISDTLRHAEYDAIIAIPACNEEEYIARAIASAELSARASSARCAFVIVVNNSDDRTFDICRSAIDAHGCDALAIDCQFGREIANIGHVRRFALDVAGSIAGAQCLLSTDADGRVSKNWVSRATSALRKVEMVCGDVAADKDDLSKLPASVQTCGIVEARLKEALNDVWFLVTGPSLRGFTNMGSGANMAFRVRSYIDAGRLPPVASGEDRALHAIFEQQGRTIRHDPGMKVVVSGRTSSAVENGMAACLASRSQSADPFVDAQLMPADLLLRYALHRRDGLDETKLPPIPPMRVSEARTEIAQAQELAKKLRMGFGPATLLNENPASVGSPAR